MTPGILHARPRGGGTVRIGLTGPIGCGKSTVAGWLRDFGAVVVDADVIARDVTAPGQPAFDAIIARFGDGLRRPDGSLDRAALGRIVFADPSALRELEAIVHPAVRPVIVAAVAAAEAAGSPAVVIEAIKLVEAGYAAECDVVWLIACDRAKQRERLLARGLSIAESDQRMAAQADLLAPARSAASVVLDTSGALEATRVLVSDAYDAALRSGTRRT